MDRNLTWDVIPSCLTDGSNIFAVRGSGDGSGYEVIFECIDKAQADKLLAMIEKTTGSFIQ